MGSHLNPESSVASDSSFTREMRLANLPSILIVDDEAENRETLKSLLERSGYECCLAENGEQALDLIRKNHSLHLLITDLKMPGILNGLELLKAARLMRPDMHRILVTAYGSIEETVEAMKTGALDVLTKPIKFKNLLELIQQRLGPAEKVAQLEPQNHSSQLPFHPRWENVLQKISKAAASEATVLLTGESGSGKNFLAKILHQKSQRNSFPFVSINMASLAPELIESELFGHEKGAFTGALSSREGKVAASEKGTLFLDEIGDLPLSLQPKILQLLQDKTYFKVGSDTLKHANIRIVAATHQNLPDLVKRGLFREDLFFRLRVIEIPVPPLREHLSDLVWLVPHLLDQLCQKNHLPPMRLSPRAYQKLYLYSFPGNVRELENILERSIVLSSSQEISLGLLEDVEIESPHEGDFSPLKENNRAIRKLEDLEKEAIQEALLLSGGDKKIAAKVLGISERTLYRFLQENSEL